MKIIWLMIWILVVTPVVLAAPEQKINSSLVIVALNDNLTAEAQDNVQLYTVTVLASSPQALGHWQLQLKQQASLALQALGYYQPLIEVTTAFDLAGYHAKLTIDQGPATIISVLNIKLIGAAEHDSRFLHLISQSPLQLGRIFNHGDYQNFKNAVSDLAITRGYFYAQWQTAEVKVDPSTNQAQIKLVFNSGERFKFGEIMFSQESEAQPLILTMSTLKPQQYYHSNLLAQYNLALSNSKYFSVIEVYPDLTQALDNVVPIAVNIVEKPANSIVVGGEFLLITAFVDA